MSGSEPFHDPAIFAESNSKKTEVTIHGDMIGNIKDVALTWGQPIPWHQGKIRVSGLQIWSSGYYNLKTHVQQPGGVARDWSGVVSWSAVDYNIIAVGIDVAYSFGYNGDPLTPRRLVKLFFDDVLVYDITKPEECTIRFNMHYGDHSEADAIIAGVLQTYTTYFPDQIYILFYELSKKNENDPLPKTVIAEFNVIEIQNGGGGGGSSGDPTPEPIEVVMPNWRVPLTTILRNILTFSQQFTADQISFSPDITETAFGAFLIEPDLLTNVLNNICNLFDITIQDNGTSIYFYKNVDEATFIIAEEFTFDQIGLGGEDDDPSKAFEIENTTLETTSTYELKYIDPDANYLTNTVTWSPANAPSTAQKQTINTILILVKDEATVLIQHLYQTQKDSETKYTFRLPLSKGYLGKGDIVRVTDRDFSQLIRITEDTYNGDFSITLEGTGLTLRSEIDLPIADAPIIPPALTYGETQGNVFDVPALINAHNPADTEMFIQYENLIGVDANWQGGYLTRKVDDAYKSIYASGTKDVLAFSTTNALTFKRWTFDTDQLSVTTLFGEWDAVNNKTKAQLLTDRRLNLAFYGHVNRWEIVQFCGIANGKVYGILRGMRGTDVWADNHVIGDLFVVFGSNFACEIRNQSLIDELEDYRAISPDQIPANVDMLSIRVKGASLRPWAPVNVKLVKQNNGDIVITWTRRDRKGHGWFQTLPLSETSEKYKVRIYQGSNVIRTIDTVTPTATYTVADQTTDSLQTAAAISLSVVQMSSADLLGLERKDSYNVQ